MIPAEHALRACLALKLWSIERKSHVMALVADEGLALFAGLNVMPKKSYLSEYSSRVEHRPDAHCWRPGTRSMSRRGTVSTAHSFNLDFHSVPYYGEHPVVEQHYVSARSRRQKSVLVFLAQDADGRSFCYSNADLRKGEEAEEIFRFITFWKRTHGQLPRHLVFDSKLTTYAESRPPRPFGHYLHHLAAPGPGAPARKLPLLPRPPGAPSNSTFRRASTKTPAVYEQKVRLAGQKLSPVLSSSTSATTSRPSC